MNSAAESGESSLQIPVTEQLNAEKNLLQELTQKLGFELPRYSTNRVGGTDDLPKFCSIVTVNGESFLSGGTCRNKVAAEHAAAKAALDKLLPPEDFHTRKGKTGFYKSQLQLYSQKYFKQVPVYEVRSVGTLTMPSFEARVMMPGPTSSDGKNSSANFFYGEKAKTKKLAESSAACAALKSRGWLKMPSSALGKRSFNTMVNQQPPTLERLEVWPTLEGPEVSVARPPKLSSAVQARPSSPFQVRHSRSVQPPIDFTVGDLGPYVSIPESRSADLQEHPISDEDIQSPFPSHQNSDSIQRPQPQILLGHLNANLPVSTTTTSLTRSYGNSSEPAFILSPLLLIPSTQPSSHLVPQTPSGSGYPPIALSVAAQGQSTEQPSPAFGSGAR